MAAKPKPKAKPRGAKLKDIPPATRQEALRLRRAGGSYASIGRQLKLTPKMTERAIAEGIGECVEESPALRAQLDMERMDGMLLGLWERVKSGDTGAVDKALRVIDARAKMVEAYTAATAPPTALCITLADGKTALLGRPETVARKRRFLECLEQKFTIAEAARDAAVGVQTYYEWIQSDPLFYDFARAAQSAVVDRAETKLLDMGMRGHYTALISFLNANHPAYGRIRYEILERMMLPYVDEVIKLAGTYIPAASADTFRAELLRAAERALSNAAAK